MKMFVSLLVLCLASVTAQGADHRVTQKDRAFSVEHLQVKVGDTVHFENQDEYFHNVYSLSDANFFDLKSYPKGESRSNTLDRKSVV